MSSKRSSPVLPSSPAEFVARCTIIAGPNGSGKSSIYDMVRPPGEFVNADAVARRIDPAKPEAVSIAAGKEVLARLRVLVEEGRDFVYETTLSSRQSLTLMREARAAGFEVVLVFVTLAAADLNVLRVADRVRRGGHSIPEATIRRRHAGAFERLTQAIPIAHSCLIYDNTNQEAELLLRIDGLAVVATRLDGRSPQHMPIARSVATAISCELQDILAGRG